MVVLDSEDFSWFLIRGNESLYLNVYCSHSAAVYDFLLQLNEIETFQFSISGRSYINRLAQDIQYSAPGVIGSNSKYTYRNVRDHFGQEAYLAIKKIRANQSREFL